MKTVHDTLATLRARRTDGAKAKNARTAGAHRAAATEAALEAKVARLKEVSHFTKSTRHALPPSPLLAVPPCPSPHCRAG